MMKKIRAEWGFYYGLTMNYGNIWEYMGIYGNIWEYMGIYGDIVDRCGYFLLIDG
jgi:hypothetical protein